MSAWKRAGLGLGHPAHVAIVAVAERGDAPVHDAMHVDRPVGALQRFGEGLVVSLLGRGERHRDVRVADALRGEGALRIG